ncbi:MAG: GntR family transcriptional regulator [Clostridiales bacterium]|jgi:GntR family transcriptional regulator|nr:GntR family transcriptional regulator [Clostridiales bacterium]
MIFIDLQGKAPIYEQIKEQVIFLIQQGVYAPNDQLPSVRALAGELSVNFNTVKRAFAELEREGMVYSVAGKGVYVDSGAVNNKKMLSGALLSVGEAVKTAKAKGVAKEKIDELINNIYKEEREND